MRRGIGLDYPSNKAEIKLSACRVSRETPADMIARAINDLKIRCEAVIQHKSFHFETEYYKFKPFWKCAKPPCPTCSEKHHCNCPTSKRRCENVDDDASSISSLGQDQLLDDDDDFQFSDLHDMDSFGPLDGAMEEEEWPEEWRGGRRGARKKVC